MKALVLNLALASGWTLLGPDPEFHRFILGWLIGFALIALGRRVFNCEDYVRRTTALVRFLFSFSGQFVAAHFAVLKVTLGRPLRALHPGYLDYDVRGLRHFEIILLSFFTSLTPGTVVARIALDRHRLVVHALDAAEPDRVRRRIDSSLRDKIVAFTR